MCVQGVWFVASTRPLYETIRRIVFRFFFFLSDDDMIVRTYPCTRERISGSVIYNRYTFSKKKKRDCFLVFFFLVTEDGDGWYSPRATRSSRIRHSCTFYNNFFCISHAGGLFVKPEFEFCFYHDMFFFFCSCPFASCSGFRCVAPFFLLKYFEFSRCVKKVIFYDFRCSFPNNGQFTETVSLFSICSFNPDAFLGAEKCPKIGRLFSKTILKGILSFIGLGRIE